MAYALLATVPPVYGLYCSMFASFFYFFFGSSRHLSLSTVAVVANLVGSCLDRNVPLLLSNTKNTTTDLIKEGYDTSDDAERPQRVLMATALGMAVGLVQLVMGVMRLGFLTRLLSEPMLAGFAVGSSVQVAVSQVFTIFGLNIKKHREIFHAPLMIYAGLISYFMDFKTKFNVRVVGSVPAGFPKPKVPELSLVSNAATDVIVIALVGFSLSFSIASFFGQKGGYKVDANQELIAFGITNISGSFFSTYPVSGSISRTTLAHSMGGKSQIAGLIASIFVFVVVLFAGPLFYDLPICSLSATIFVGLHGMFLQTRELPGLWRKSKWDFATWVVTFLSTVFLDVLYGLIVGVIFSILVVFYRTQFSKAFTIDRFENTEVFKRCDEFDQETGIRIIRYEGELLYAGADHFASSVISASGFDPRPIALDKRKLESDLLGMNAAKDRSLSTNDIEGIASTKQPREDLEGDVKDAGKSVSVNGCCKCCWPCRRHRHDMSPSEAIEMKKVIQNQLSDLLANVPLTHLILDCSAWNSIDVVGAGTLQNLILDYNDAGVRLYLSSLSKNAYDFLVRFGLFDVTDQAIVFISVYDAYKTARQQRMHSNTLTSFPNEEFL
ncbi:hypothetical protein Aperf_G00000036500 [Anoplocephala perfoliata]